MQLSGLLAMLIMKAIKEGYELWCDLGFYIWMMNWRRAEEQAGKIDVFNKNHPIANIISCVASSIF